MKSSITKARTEWQVPWEGQQSCGTRPEGGHTELLLKGQRHVQGKGHWGGGPDRGQCEVQSVSRSEKSRLLCMAVMYALEPRGEVTESGEVGRGQITRSSARSGPQVGKNGGSRRFRSLAAATPVRGGVSLS